MRRIRSRPRGRGSNVAKAKDGTELFEVRSSLVRHLNKQTIGANSSTVIGESITNPAYREAASDEYLGILIVGAFMDRKYSAPFTFNNGQASIITSQIQYGDQSVTPAIKDRDDQFLHSHGSIEWGWASSVGFQDFTGLLPMPIQKMHPDDVIVTPEFTVVHDFDSNAANYQSKEVHTEILYHVVKVPDKVFTRMLMDQTRTS